MSFTTQPTPHETCSCGAEWFPTFAAANLAREDKQAFRDAHAPCRLTWQRCPVCNGVGTVPPDFYTQLGMATGTSREQCRSCTGSGVMTRPSSAGIQPESAKEAATA